MTHKFLDLVESTIQRMTNNGILVGDRVELTDDYKTKECYKCLPDAVKEYIEDMFTNNDLNKKVINVKTANPNRYPDNDDNRGELASAVVAVELANGLYDNQNAVTVPMAILKPIEDYPNRTPVPDSQRYDNRVEIKPREIDEEDLVDITRKTQQGDTLKKTNLDLPTKNTSIPSKPATKTPAVKENYTAGYMIDM